MPTVKHEPNHKLQAWLTAATPALREVFCKLATTSTSMYRQWANGRRKMSARVAGNVETAMYKISEQFEDAPSPLTRGDLCEACAQCPYYIHNAVDIAAVIKNRTS